jgi:hypothetical protein
MEFFRRLGLDRSLGSVWILGLLSLLPSIMQQHQYRFRLCVKNTIQHMIHTTKTAQINT